MDTPNEEGGKPKVGIENHEITAGIESTDKDCDKQELEPIEPFYLSFTDAKE